jgi:hypothetical protein
VCGKEEERLCEGLSGRSRVVSGSGSGEEEMRMRRKEGSMRDALVVKNDFFFHKRVRMGGWHGLSFFHATADAKLR